jgi:hypothetical protein
MPDQSDDPDEAVGDAEAMPGDEPADVFDEIQTDLMHVREDARRSIGEPLNQITGALDSMQDEAETDARPDRLESIERELLELQEDADPETKARLQDVVERLERLREAHEREE